MNEYRSPAEHVPPTFALLALSVPGSISLLFSQNLQAALATVGITLASIFVAMVLYTTRPTRVALHFLLLLIPIAIFYRILYRGALSTGVLLSITSTTASEAAELLSNHLWLTACLGLFVAFALYCMFASWSVKNPFSFRKRACLFAAASVAVLLWVGAAFVQARDQHLQFEWVLKDGGREVFPLDAILSTKILLVGKLETAQAAAARRHFEFEDVHAVTSGDAAGPMTYVVVIGEASRRRNWSLYGYGRPTTPLLDAMRHDLVIFGQGFANANITLYSVSMSLTRATPTSWAIGRREKSILSLLRQAGYTVDWISNQDQYGFSENPVSAIALEANFTSFAGDDVHGLGVAKDTHDSNLIPRLATVLARAKGPNEKTVIFLHLMGSHDSYRERYPPAFGVFKTPYSASVALSDRHQQFIDDYDNSIRFTDSVVASIIKTVAALDQDSAVLYFSDHGERLYEGDLPNLRGHGFPIPSKVELEVPLFVWLSPSYRSKHPERVMTLESNTGSVVQLHSIFETIVDLAGLTYTHRSPDLSLFSRNLQIPEHLEILSTSQTALCLPVPGHDGLRNEHTAAEADATASARDVLFSKQEPCAH